MFRIYADGQLMYNPPNENYIVLTPQLTLEMGKSGSLQFGLLPSNKMYGKLNKLRTIVTVEYDDVEIFRGRVFSTERTFDNTINYFCEGDLSFLVDTEQRQEAFEGQASVLFAQIIANHNSRVDSSKQFVVGEFTVPDRDVIISGVSDDIEDAETGKFDYEQIAINASESDWIKTLDAIQDWIIAYTGGYLRTRYANNQYYIDLVADYGTTTTQEIEFGRNLLDLTEEISAEDLFTVLIPLGDKGLTIAEVNDGSDELVDAEAVAKYGRIMKSHTFSSVTDPMTLLENGQRYLENEVNVPVTVSVRAVDLHMVNPEMEEIHVGDRVKVKSDPHSMVEYLTCSKIEYDLENAANDAYTFGNVKQTLTQRYRKNVREKAEAAEKAAHKGGGGAGQIIDDTIETAWVRYVRDGHLIEIGTIRDLENRIKNRVGIDVSSGSDNDPSHPNINIYNIIDHMDAQDGQIANTIAQIQVLNSAKDEHEAAIILNAQNLRHIGETENAHYAELKVLANDNESAIELNAERISINASNYTDLEGEVHQGFIEINKKIRIIDNNIEGIGNLIAETITTDYILAKLGRVETVIINRLGGTYGYVKTFRADDLGTSNGQTYATQEWVEEQAEDMATQTWVNNQGFLKAVPDIFDCKTISANTVWANSCTVGGKMVATQQWVNEQGFVKTIPTSVTNLNVTGTLKSSGNIVATQEWVRNNFLQSVPSTYATQSWVSSQFSSIESNYSKVGHKHSWSEINNKPTTFPPSSHSHSVSWDDISGKPRCYYPNSHRHSASVSGYGTIYTSYFGG